MKLWIDDLRDPPSKDWHVAHIDHKTSESINQYRSGGTAPWQENMHKSDSTFGTTTTFEF